MAKDFSATRLPGFTTIAIGTFVLLYLPIATLVIYSFNANETVSNWGGFSLTWYAKAWGNEAVQKATWLTAQLAAIAAGLSTVIATMAALGTTRRTPFRGQTAIYVLINQPIMVPEIVAAAALLIFFAMIKVSTGYQGIGYLVLAHTAFCIPFAYLPIRARLEGMDAALEVAAGDLYASPWQTFRHVTLPLMAPGVLAGAMLAFVISLDDVIITEFIKSAGQETLPTYMLGQIKRAVTPEINAVSTVLLGFTVLLLTAFFLITRKRD